MQRILLLSCLLWLSACNNNQTDSGKTGTAPVAVPKVAPASKLDEKGTEKLLYVVNSYYALKDALVASKSEHAEKSAAIVGTVTDSFKAYLGAYPDVLTGIAPELDTIQSFSKKIAALHGDEKLEEQRASFEKISDNLFALLKKTGLTNAGVYRQFCPMAFEDKGAYWLSNVSEIRNPYFGKKMLECGEVTDSL